MNYAKYLNTQNTPQTQPLFGREKEQVVNNAGGLVFSVTPEQQLLRFLILGTQGGTYYQTEQKMTVNNARDIIKMIQADGPMVLRTVVDVSTSQPARVPKNDACIFVLALCAKFGNEQLKDAAFEALPKVCRIPTHLFQFIENWEQIGGGWGRRTKRAIGKWYLQQGGRELAYAVSKYQGRNKWTNRDVLRLAHPVPTNAEQNGVFKWVLNKERTELLDSHFSQTDAGAYLEAASKTLSGKLTAKEAVKLIQEQNLPREVIATELLNEKEVWDALLQKMPITAMIRNLATMTRIGLLTGMSDATQVVLQKLNKDALVKGRVHPISVLLAQLTYAQGRSMKGSNTWIPIPKLVAALEQAFYDAFGSVTPHGKRTLIALDISGSMHSGEVSGIPGLTPAMASAAMAMLTTRVENRYEVMGFGSPHFAPLPFINGSNTLKTVLEQTRRMNFGMTDCSLPMQYALQNKLPVEVFQVFTDNETYNGHVHASEMIKQYRQKTGIDAKLAVFGMTATQFTIADPRDPGMMDFVGLDTAAPQVLRAFVEGWK